MNLASGGRGSGATHCVTSSSELTGPYKTWKMRFSVPHFSGRIRIKPTIMALFVHLTPESRVNAIRRNGIARMRMTHDGQRGIFAMPVTRNFYISHQWLRELKRGRSGPIVGVYFRIDDAEIVSVGHYNQAHQDMTAAEAVAEILASENAEGFEVFIRRKIEAHEIHRVRELPQVVGWRYAPRSHGRKPCGCRFCQRGQYGAKKLRDEYERS